MTTAANGHRTAEARRDFEEALDRLQRCQPRDSKLAKLAVTGKLRINVASVAREAGRSRTLIGTENCRFPDIRARVLSGVEVQRGRVKGVTSVVQGLRGENKALREQVASLRSQQALILARMLAAERETELLRADLAAAARPTALSSGAGAAPFPVRPGAKFGRRQ